MQLLKVKFLLTLHLWHNTLLEPFIISFLHLLCNRPVKLLLVKLWRSTRDILTTNSPFIGAYVRELHVWHILHVWNLVVNSRRTHDVSWLTESTDISHCCSFTNSSMACRVDKRALINKETSPLAPVCSMVTMSPHSANTLLLIVKSLHMRGNFLYNSRISTVPVFSTCLSFRIRLNDVPNAHIIQEDWTERSQQSRLQYRSLFWATSLSVFNSFSIF